MPPRLRLRPPLLAARARLPPATARPPACLFCSLQRAKPRTPHGANVLLAAARPAAARRATTAAEAQRTTEEAPDALDTLNSLNAPDAPPRTPAQIRADLADALRALQQHAGGALVNLSRIQLAIRGLQQPPGQESIRVAVLGLAARVGGKAAKELLRLILADPLQDEQPWEAQLAGHDPAQPLIVRVRGPNEDRGGDGSTSQQQHTDRVVRFDTDGGLAELEVSSPALDGSQLEFLVMASTLAVPTPPAPSALLEGGTETFAETVLVPAVEIPTSASAQDGSGGRRFTPVTAPVHQALIVADGILGAAAVANLPLDINQDDEIKAAVNLGLAAATPEEGAPSTTTTAALPFAAFDAAASAKALALFRASAANARAYEALWTRGGVSPLARWLRQGALRRDDGATKPPVRRLVASVLRGAQAGIQEAEGRLSGNTTTTTTTSTAPATAAFASLDAALARWAEAAHAELQAQLDLAFAGRRWRQLGWWKLFWRADDVTMLSSGLVAQRFLPRAEQDVVFLAGRIDEAARLAGVRGGGEGGGVSEVGLYAAPVVADSSAAASAPPTQWPTHIAFTRRYLLDETVPALQALAQRLVLQALGTSGLTAALAALTYLSSLGAYEAGAVAALGLVWSLGHMQKTWEAARRFWEGEVREEGRKAVRAVEASVAAALDGARGAAAAGAGQGGATAEDRRRLLRDLRQARALVDRAEEVLARLK